MIVLVVKDKVMICPVECIWITCNYIQVNYEERHSYRLDYIGEMELGEKKVAHEGSLDRLYNHDSRSF